jgi:hypothetical protein
MKIPRAWTNAGKGSTAAEPSRCSVLTLSGVRALIDLVSALQRRG